MARQDITMMVQARYITLRDAPFYAILFSYCYYAILYAASIDICHFLFCFIFFFRRFLHDMLLLMRLFDY